jgi:uncharacterized membrane protein
MPRKLRIALYVYAALTLNLAIGFALQMDWATRLWPWEVDRLSYIFVGSVLAALAGSFAAWAYTNEPAGGQAIALNAFVVTTAGATHFLRVYQRTDDSALLAAAVVFAISAVAYGLIAARTFRYAFRDRIHAPALVRWSFAGFAAAMAIGGVLLITDNRSFFPWPLNSDSAVIFGWVFLGDGLFFLHGVLRPYRNNARGQLANFLAFDLVLLVPFVRHFSDATDDQLVGLGIWTAIIVISGVLAVYYLLIDARTRLVQLPQVDPRPTTAS